MKRTLLAAALAALLAAPAVAAAESPRRGSFELGAGKYRPDVDSDYVPTGNDPGAPYGLVYGTARDWSFRVGASWALFTWPGALEAGVRTGFFRASAYAFEKTADGGITAVRSTDRTTFSIIPTSLTLTYRLDLLAQRLSIPLAPYGRVALERYNWWITGGSGGMAKRGATNGWSYGGGVAFLLDVVDPGLAREMDADTGFNDSYVYADVTKTRVDDFGSGKSWDLSDEKLSWSVGLMFVF